MRCLFLILFPVALVACASAPANPPAEADVAIHYRTDLGLLDDTCRSLGPVSTRSIDRKQVEFAGAQAVPLGDLRRRVLRMGGDTLYLERVDSWTGEASGIAYRCAGGYGSPGT